MTFKDLLDLVPFEEVAPLIPKMYPDMKGMEGMFKLHYDMLKLLTPKFDPNANAPTCTISIETDEDGSHLTAYPMEGDLWEHSLTKKIIVEPEVKATWAEIATCCLWHTSFYGFTPNQQDDKYNELFIGDEYDGYKKLTRRNAVALRKAGGFFPSVKELNPAKKKELMQKAKEEVYYDKATNAAKWKKELRRKFMALYYERMVAISEFIISVMPSLSKTRNQNYLNVSQLCGLFDSTKFYKADYTSYVSPQMNISSAKYLAELFEKYEMVDSSFDSMILEIITSKHHEVLTDDEQELCNVMFKFAEKNGDLIVGTDPTLGNQTRIRFAYYNIDKPLVQ